MADLERIKKKYDTPRNRHRRSNERRQSLFVAVWLM
jgi:hypothetical protein